MMVEQKMKANNGKGNNESGDNWETPKELWNKLNDQYSFKFDCCASHINSKCKYFASERTEFQISTLIKYVAWMNPPFSKAYDMFNHFFDIVKKGVAIYRCDNIETKVWQEQIFKYASWVFVFDKRICYEGQKGKGARFPSALIGFNVPKPKGLSGTLMKCI